MVYVVFIGCIGMSSTALLNQFKKLTPGGEGKWGKLVGTDQITKANVVVILESLGESFDKRLLKNKQVICFPLEPPIIRAAKRFPLNSTKMYLDQHPFLVHFFGFLNPQIDYDQLKSLPHAPKPKNLCLISSNIKLTASHFQRYEFIKRIMKDVSDCDLFGYGWDDESPKIKNYKGAFGNGYRGNKINSPYKNKLDVLKEYNYVIVIENSQYHNYFTEKITDVVLGWSYPIYFGAPNIKKCFPSGSVTCINIHNYDQAVKTIKTLTTNPPTETMIKALGECRNKILNHYNIWPSVERLVKAK